MTNTQTVLLLGVGPLPCYRSRALFGFGIRTWQFLLPMLKAGHRVILVTFEFGRGQDPLSIEYAVQPEHWGNVVHVPLAEPNDKNRLRHVATLMRLVYEHEPDAIVTAGSSIASGMAVALPTELPLWVDLFGDLMAEVQAKAVFTGDEELDFFHRLYLPILRRADRFSSVSEAQRYATYGQLGIIGRLTGSGLGDPLVHSIPCAIDGDLLPVRGKRLLRGDVLSRRDVALLCTGGFNTWADVDTLIRGLESAMERNHFIHLVVTGGAIPGHHNEGFDRFAKWVDRSPYRDRCHVLGWIPNEDVPSTYAECDLGLNVDLNIAESMLGSRNRCLSWMQAGLPIVTTISTEISRILAAHSLCYGVPVGQPERLADTILQAADDVAGRGRMAIRALRFVYQYWTFDETTKPLLAWLERPRTAKDRLARTDRASSPLPLDKRLDAFIGNPVIRAGEGVPPPKRNETKALSDEILPLKPLVNHNGASDGRPLWLRKIRRLVRRWIER